MAVLMFVPQWSVVILAGILLHYDLFFCIMVQTWAFVAFNKVMTAQYFLWYMSLMPFISINNGIIHEKPILGIILYLCQIGFMVFWGYFAFNLEFHSNNYFSEIGIINQVFFCINVLSIVVVSRYHRLTITYEISGQNTVQKTNEKLANTTLGLGIVKCVFGILLISL